MVLSCETKSRRSKNWERPRWRKGEKGRGGGGRGEMRERQAETRRWPSWGFLITNALSFVSFKVWFILELSHLVSECLEVPAVVGWKGGSWPCPALWVDIPLSGEATARAHTVDKTAFFALKDLGTGNCLPVKYIVVSTTMEIYSLGWKYILYASPSTCCACRRGVPTPSPLSPHSYVEAAFGAYWCTWLLLSGHWNSDSPQWVLHYLCKSFVFSTAFSPLGGGDVPAPSKGRCSARCWQSQPMLFWPAVRYMFLLIVLLIKSIDYFNGEKWNIIRCNLTALTSFQALTLMWKAKTTMDRSWKVTDTYTQLWTLDWEWGKK